MMLYYCYVLHIPIHTPLYHTHSLYVLIQKDLAANITEEQGKYITVTAMNISTNRIVDVDPLVSP